MLTQSKVKRALQNQSNIALRVYDCTPIQDTWEAYQILRAVKEANGGNTPELRIVSGCLNDLKEAGLLKESPRGFYRRTPVKPTAETGEDDLLDQLDAPEIATTTAALPATSVVVSTPTVKDEIMTPVSSNVHPIAIGSQEVQTVVPADMVDKMANITAQCRTMAQNLLSLMDQVDDMALQLEAKRVEVNRKEGEIQALKNALRALNLG